MREGSGNRLWKAWTFLWKSAIWRSQLCDIQCTTSNRQTRTFATPLARSSFTFHCHSQLSILNSQSIPFSVHHSQPPFSPWHPSRFCQAALMLKTTNFRTVILPTEAQNGYHAEGHFFKVKSQSNHCPFYKLLFCSILRASKKVPPHPHQSNYKPRYFSACYPSEIE